MKISGGISVHYILLSLFIVKYFNKILSQRVKGIKEKVDTGRENDKLGQSERVANKIFYAEPSHFVWWWLSGAVNSTLCDGHCQGDLFSSSC